MRTRKFLSKLIPALPMLLMAALVIIVTVIFLTAMRSKAHAQFGGVEQPMFQVSAASQSFIPSQIPGMFLWWIASDQTNGVTVTNWIDRIQGMAYTNSVASAPTNSASGVYFSGSTWLDNSPPVSWLALSALTNTVVVIMSPHTPVDDFSGVIQTKSPGDEGGYGFYTSFNGRIRQQGLNGTSYSASFASGQTLDYLTMMISAPSHWNGIYTNGILSANISLGIWEDWKALGRYKGGARYYKGYVKEIMAWTNTAMSSVNISNIHYYATNTYNFNP